MKPFDQLLKPHSASAVQGIGLEQSYQLAQICSLPEQAPAEIRKLWTVAQHLLAYSCLEYPFVVTADFMCAAVVEAALREECKEEIQKELEEKAQKGKKAVEPTFERVLQLFKLKVARELSPEETDFLFGRLDAFRKLRNAYAHPKQVTLYPPSNSVMIRTSEWLGAYYKGELKSFVIQWMAYSDRENARIREAMERIQNFEKTQGHSDMAHER